jgi:hypothetical protein
VERIQAGEYLLARQYNLTLATRNTSEYRHAGVRLVDPCKG